MAYIQVEASVRTHKKFLKAGPAASWLWLCGMGYCQDGLTDGFIPFEALSYLGVKAPNNLKSRLVSVGLWVDVPGGWRVHDYLKHNKSADDIRRIKDERIAGGSKGGRPRKGHLDVPDSPGVYFIRSNDHVKIGSSGTLRARIKSQATPGTELLAFILTDTAPMALELEAKLHRQFAHKKANGEWFTLDAEITSFVTTTETLKGNHPENPSHLISATATTTATAERRAPLHDSHKKHAVCGRICLHASQFNEFVRRRNHDGAEREIDRWALGVIAEWTDGAHANDEPGEPFEFWRVRYAEKWPAVTAAAKKPWAPLRAS